MASEIRIPRLGWSMEEGLFVGWLKPAGAYVAEGEPLFELEGEKALQEIASLDAGYLRHASDCPAAGTTVAVGTVIGYLDAVPNAAPTDAVVSPKPSAADKRTAEPARLETFQPRPASNSPGQSPAAGPAMRRLARQMQVPLETVVGSGPAGRILEQDLRAVQAAAGRSLTSGIRSAARAAEANATERFGSQWATIASPRARRVASELGLDWRQLAGTGRGGRVREADVRAAANRNRQATADRMTGTKLPASDGTSRSDLRRKAIAQHLRVGLDQALPVTLTTSINAAPLMALRQQFKGLGGKQPGDRPVPSYTDITACIVARVLRQHPRLAARWEGDPPRLFLPGSEPISIGLAVDTPDGLLVPVLADAETMRLVELAQQSQRLIQAAREGRLTAAEMQGGQFTLTNLGAYGVETFTPMLNFPEVAILGLGAIRAEAIVDDEGRITAGHRMSLSLTFDHAAIDGAPAAAFLQELSRGLETPAAVLLS